ncbi:methyltransferase domain-containing protein [Cupriavidus sp. NPDC089707]|uniref:methyltransferase domain-containing protein n=1 Tax=Cupriavidus sp. NPDC089707 TaxID=3363963 RepID=UPI003826CAC2
MSMQEAVYERYSCGARATEPQLCCPVSYDPRYLAAIPPEILDKDYGCGDPSRHVRPGDTVLDLGSGGGKICYLAAQIVGAQGQVIGVDMNDDMLALARKYQPHMAQLLGGDRVRFLKGNIQDLALDVAAMETWLTRHPVHDARGLVALQAWQAEQKRQAPLVPDASVDLVISNCVLNLVDEHEKEAVVREIFRVLRPHGRAAISDIVADEPVPAALKADPQLWSGCISGAFTETAFLQAFAQAGFVAVGIDAWSSAPWQVVHCIEFRAVTLVAQKPSGQPCIDKGHAVIYRGPFASVTDDEGHRFPRSERMAVCERTYQLLMQGDYRAHFIGIEPVGEQAGEPYCAPPGTRRPASESKRAVHLPTNQGATCCNPGAGCC